MFSLKPLETCDQCDHFQWICIPFAWTHEAVADIQWSDWTEAWVNLFLPSPPSFLAFDNPKNCERRIMRNLHHLSASKLLSG